MLTRHAGRAVLPTMQVQKYRLQMEVYLDFLLDKNYTAIHICAAEYSHNLNLTLRTYFYRY